MKNCINCNYEVNGKYCPNCGTPVIYKRIDGIYIYTELFKILNLDSGFFYTFFNLLLSPGKTLNKYIEGNRKKIMKPISFMIFSFILHGFIFHLLTYFQVLKDTNFGIEISTDNVWSVDSTLKKIINENFVITLLIYNLIRTICLKLLFNRMRYNIFEYFTLMCYFTGQTILFNIIFICFYSLFNFELNNKYIDYFILIYYMYFINTFFSHKFSFIIFVKTFLSFILSSIIVLLLLFLIKWIFLQ